MFFKDRHWVVASCFLLLAVAKALTYPAASRRRIREIRAARAAKGLCPNCGYDLRASHNSCPECGECMPVK
jgi:predicted amidophosphoribosyltransferase